MSVTVVYFLESMQVENDKRKPMGISDGPVEFLLEVIVKKAPVVEAGQRVGRGIDLKFPQFFIFHHDRQAQQIRGRQYVHQRGLERDLLTEALGKFALPCECLVPEIKALRLGKLHMSDRSQKALQKLPASRTLQSVKRVGQQLE